MSSPGLSATTENSTLPPIPDKRYFPIGEASALCGVKAHVLRYWEQEFPQLSPPKRRGNRRYYRGEDIRVARTIRALLYDQGFTIAGARARLETAETPTAAEPIPAASQQSVAQALSAIRQELETIRQKLEH